MRVSVVFMRLLLLWLVVGCDDQIRSDDARLALDLFEPSPDLAMMADAHAPDADTPRDTVGLDMISPSPSRSLSGAWVGEWNIGNCINMRHWLVFDAPTSFTWIIEDDNFCGGYTLTTWSGHFEMRDNDVLSISYRETWPSGEVLSTVQTSTYFIDTQADAGESLRFDAALMRDDARWHRVESLQVEGPHPSTQTIDLSIDLDVDLTQPPAGDGPWPCQLVVDIAVETARTPPGEEDAGRERFSLPCLWQQTTPGQGWVRASVLEDSFSASEWREVVEEQGVYQRFNSFTAVLIEQASRPQFWFIIDPISQRPVLFTASTWQSPLTGSLVRTNEALPAD